MAILALSGAWIMAALLLLRTSVPRGLDLPELDPRDFFSAAELAQQERYERVLRWLFLAAVAAQVAVLVALVRAAPRLLRRRLPFRPVVQGAALAAGAVLATWLAQLPFALAAHWWRRRYGVSRQGYLDWLAEPWLGLGVQATLIAAAVAGGMVLAAWLGPRWWLVGAPLAAAGAAALIVAQPLLLQPRVEPLRKPRLVATVQALAERTGVGDVDVVVEDVHRRTRVANAEVYGLGPTRRVVLWDTLFGGRFSDREIEVLVAHELGHIARHHIWKGLAWAALVALPVTFLIAQAANLRGGLARPDAVPLALLAITLLAILLSPAVNAVSRRYEAEADWEALEVTRDPGGMEGLMIGLARASLSDPDPPTWAFVMLRTHPTVMQRLAMAEAWKARAVSARRTRAPRAGS